MSYDPAIKLLNEFMETFPTLDVAKEVFEGQEWLQDRCSDEHTPVNGDARVHLDALLGAFLRQNEKIDYSSFSVAALWVRLPESKGSTDPNVIKGIRLMGTSFYRVSGSMPGSALDNVESHIDEFYRLWSLKF